MYHETFEFEDFANEFTPAAEVANEFWPWPSMHVDIEYRFHSAEPDVGIFSEQLEVTSATYFLDDVTYTTDDAFAAAVYDEIACYIDEDAAFVAARIEKQVALWEEGLEPQEG